MKNLEAYVLVALFVGFAIAAVVILVKDQDGPPCLQETCQPFISVIMVNKVMVPITTQICHCVEYAPADGGEP